MKRKPAKQKAAPHTCEFAPAPITQAGKRARVPMPWFRVQCVECDSLAFMRLTDEGQLVLLRSAT